MMSTANELHQILHSLVAVWPEEHDHIAVEQARAFLEAYPERHNGVRQNDAHTRPSRADEDYYSSMWYSI